jgi:hypothetical protein
MTVLFTDPIICSLQSSCRVVLVADHVTIILHVRILLYKIVALPVLKVSEKCFHWFPGQQQAQQGPVSELCLGCICEAVSNCNRSLGCNGDVCGLFRITWAYWADAGKPVIAQDHSDNEGGESSEVQLHSVYSHIFLYIGLSIFVSLIQYHTNWLI